MITDKRLSLLALLLLLCLLFCSCQTDTAGLASLHSLGSGESGETATPAAEYDYVILPTAADETLVARAQVLTAALSAQTGIPASLFFDDEVLPHRENLRLILLGNTTHALSQKHLHDLRRDDYVCVTDESALLLGGKSDAATVAAIDRFTEQLLPYADAEILVNQDQHFLVRATYDITSVTLNGFSLGDYRIVYPKKSENGEKAVAVALREAIADRCGFYLDILSDHLVTEQTRVIAVGACFDPETSTEPQILASGACITLCGNSEYALATAAEALCEHLLPNDAPESVQAMWREPIPVSVPSPSLSVLAGLLVENNLEAALTKIAEISANARNAAAALMPFGRVNQNVFPYLQANLSAYADLSLAQADDEVLPFFYREDKLTLLERQPLKNGQMLRFSIKESDVCFRVYHGYGDDEIAMNVFLDAAAQGVSESEATLVFLATPSSVPIAEVSKRPFRTPLATERATERIQLLVHLPASLASTTITSPTAVHTPYLFYLTHSFLRK